MLAGGIASTKEFDDNAMTDVVGTQEMEETELSRRELLRGVALTGVGAVVGTAISPAEVSAAEPTSQGATMRGVPFEPAPVVRIGIIGVGGRGSGLLANLLGCEGVVVPAVCDIDKAHADRAATRITRAGQPAPTLYTAGDKDYENLCRRDDLHFVIVATPWDWHVPMAVAAMTNGKHVGVEVPVATTLADCWKLVDTSEKTRRHCLILENCCYGYNELLALNMVRSGALGDLTHGEAAYLHDLRGVLFDQNGEGAWRRAEHVKRNGDLYPTHGLGPVARYLDIHNGDRFDVLVSLSSLEHSLTAYQQKTLGPDDVRRKETYRCGDMNNAILRTAQGRTVLLQHDVVSPRPYSRLNLISGTKGAFADYPARVYIDGESPHEWENLDRFKAKYEHPLWTRVGELAKKMGGHGGMDFLMLYRLVECLHQGIAPDLDVYDAAAWSAPGPLSEMSVAKGGAPQKFPDFTRGNWKEKRSG
jgi:predicted dehydrogenase